MVNLNEQQQIAYDRLKSYGRQRKSVDAGIEDKVDDFRRTLRAEFDQGMGAAIAECVRQNVPKSRMGEAYGSKDPMTIRRLIEQYKDVGDVGYVPGDVATGAINRSVQVVPAPDKGTDYYDVTVTNWTPESDRLASEPMTGTATVGPAKLAATAGKWFVKPSLTDDEGIWIAAELNHDGALQSEVQQKIESLA